MKRAEQLQKLSREHHESLVMAKKLAEVAKDGSDADVGKAIETAKEYCDGELELHFQHEERTVFAPIFKGYHAHLPLAKDLLKEHGFMRLVFQHNTPEKSRINLAEFAHVLKEHTRVEERELFPIIEKEFSDEQLDAVLNFVPLRLI